VFRRRPTRAAKPEDHIANIPHQEAFLAWADEFADLDRAALAQLTPQERRLQVLAREALWLYADALWDAAKAAGLNPANKPGVYNAIAALRDVSVELHSMAADAQNSAGEPDDDDEAVRAPIVRFAPLNQWFTPSKSGEI
jgi:hypothetical protein